MWNNYTIEMQNPGRIEDHLTGACAARLEADARAAAPRTSRLAAASRPAIRSFTHAAASAWRGAAARAADLRAGTTMRVRAARRRVDLAGALLRHPHGPRPGWGHHRA